ncbi:MAG: glycoside hydrolase family 15 protein [Acetobacteraceae bacterium]|nr:glycoside hydrolase family 15 protein [Acetobacteraceae bacterium]
MTLSIGDYAFIGDCASAALVGCDGSIDWLCWPSFSSAACFAALLGTPEHGRWLIAPSAPIRTQRRRYREGTLVLETTFTTDEGEVVLTDFMPVGAAHSSVARIVEGRSGRVKMQMQLALRFDYGATVPWVCRVAGEQAMCATAGPDMVVLRADVPVGGKDFTTVADFAVGPGERVRFTLTYGLSHQEIPAAFDADAALAATESFWADWSGRCTYTGEWPDAVKRSLVVLKALTDRSTGGMAAAPTTSLPERPGGACNWDYRFCWLRDATITLFVMLHCGYRDEAAAWEAWLRRSVAGNPDQVQPVYGLQGERLIMEWKAEWLPGYRGARPVRIGNAARGQVQLDMYGELMNALHLAAKSGLNQSPVTWSLQVHMLAHLEAIWTEPDNGIWEMRGQRRQFTFSKVMAWVAFDRGIRSAEANGWDAPVARWRSVRDEIHRSVCTRGFDETKNSFVQTYGGEHLDASLLLLPLVGFLPPDDSRIRGTLAAIERELLVDGLVTRYQAEAPLGSPPGEGLFLACSFWLADNMVLQNRRDEARALFERLLGLCNDVGLLAEEYDPRTGSACGNFPQAFSHVALIGTALNLSRADEAAAKGGVLHNPA